MSNSIVFLENYVESMAPSFWCKECINPAVEMWIFWKHEVLIRGSTSFPCTSLLLHHSTGAASLPPELTRILATVKDLDERSCGMTFQLLVALYNRHWSMENSVPSKALLWHLQISKLSLQQMLKKQYDRDSFALCRFGWKNQGQFGHMLEPTSTIHNQAWESSA